MKRIIVNTWCKALVFKENKLEQVLSEGKYWVWLDREVEIRDMTQMIYGNYNLDILLMNSDFQRATQVLHILDNEIALVFENKIFKGVLSTGKYAFWKDSVPYDFIKVDMNNIEIPSEIPLNLYTKKELASYIRSYVVEPNEQALMFVDGTFKEVKVPGTYYYLRNNSTIQLLRADKRLLQMEINGQEILTKDKASLRVTFYAQYKITDIFKALVDSKDYEKQLYVLLQLALREFVGTYSLDELLEKKDDISTYIIQSMESKASALGVEIYATGIRDLILPGEMREIMNQVLIAEKKAQANVIMRREETASTRSLLNTAKLMEDNAMLLRLKEMEYVEKIAEKINNISLTGGNQVLEQMKQIFINK